MPQSKAGSPTAHVRKTKAEPATPPDERVVEHLRKLAATELALYVKTKAAHWTVTGPLFRELHKMLDEHAEISLKAVDLIAERAVQIGATPPLTLGEVGALSIVPERTTGKLSNREMIEGLLADQTATIGALRDAIEVATKANDPSTADLFTDLIREHEEAAWYQRMTVERQSAAPDIL